MAKVTLKYENESFESLFRRFKRVVEKDGILQEVRDREHYEKPSAKRKKNKAAARKRHLREVAYDRMTPSEKKRHDIQAAKKKKVKGKKGFTVVGNRPFEELGGL